MININLLASLSTSLGNNMTKAGLNTLIGMAVVFAVLLIIAFVIYLLKFLPNNTNKYKANGDKKTNGKQNAIKAEASKPQVSKTTTQNIAGSSKDQDLTNNTELVAVITAAIMASMKEEGVVIPADGLYIRSIRRQNTYR